MSGRWTKTGYLPETRRVLNAGTDWVLVRIANSLRVQQFAVPRHPRSIQFPARSELLLPLVLVQPAPVRRIRLRNEPALVIVPHPVSGAGPVQCARLRLSGTN